MAGYCRICHNAGHSKVDTLVACNNCGSLACATHHTWWSDSKNAFCTDCFPLTLVNSLRHSASGLSSMNGNVAAENVRPLIEGVLRAHEFSLEQLIKILHTVSNEIARRMKQ